MNDNQPVIVVKDLDMGYGDFVLMRNLNFTVNRGDVFIRADHRRGDAVFGAPG